MEDTNKEIRFIPDEWIVIELGKIFSWSSGKSRPNDTVKVKTDESPIPVYGGNGILGYSSQKLFDESKLILGRVGEYCGCSHLTEKQSWISDNALYAKNILIDISLFYFKFYLNYLDLNRYANKNGQPLITQGNINQIKIVLPPITEQSNIAHILSLVQSAIQKQAQIITTTTELKNALMKKLFTEGMNGEPLKETEIGLIPESWEVVKIGEVYDFTSKPRNLKVNVTDDVPFIPMDLIPDSNIFVSKYNLKKANTLTSGTYIEDGDFLLAKITPSFENGKQAIVDIKPFTWAYATTEVIPIKERTGVSDKLYLFYYLLNDDVRMKLAGKMEGTTGRQRLSKSTLRDCLLPYPKVEEQKEIAEMLSVIDKKISFHKRKKQSLESLFQSSLHRLMTGSIRVKDATFNAKEKISSTEIL